MTEGTGTGLKPKDGKEFATIYDLADWLRLNHSESMMTEFMESGVFVDAFIDFIEYRAQDMIEGLNKDDWEGYGLEPVEGGEE